MGDAVFLAPGSARHGNNYGVGLLIRVLPSASIAEGHEREVSDLARDNPQASRYAVNFPIDVNGHPGLLSWFSLPNSNLGGMELDALLTLQHPDGVLSITLIAPLDHWDTLRPTFDRILDSLQF